MFTDRLRKELLLWLPSHRLRLFEGSKAISVLCLECGSEAVVSDNNDNRGGLTHDLMSHTQVLHTAVAGHTSNYHSCVNISW